VKASERKKKKETESERKRKRNRERGKEGCQFKQVCSLYVDRGISVKVKHSLVCWE